MLEFCSEDQPALQAQQRDGSLLAQRANRRCGVMRGRLQLPLVAARDGAFGPEGLFRVRVGVAGLV